MLKNNIRNDIFKKILDNSNFDKDDFSIKESGYNDVTICYEYDNQYYFRFKLPEKQVVKNDINTKELVYVFKGFMTPGKYSNDENFEFNSYSQLINRLIEWIRDLDSELTNISITRKIHAQNIKIEEMKKCMEEFLNNASEDAKESANQYFSDEEITNINEKLINIENTLIEKIKEYEDRENERDKQIEELKNDIEKMKKASSSMTKKNWLKKIMAIAINWSVDPVKQKQLIVGYKLLVQITKSVGIEIPEHLVASLPEGIDSVPKNN